MSRRLIQLGLFALCAWLGEFSVFAQTPSSTPVRSPNSNPFAVGQPNEGFSPTPGEPAGPVIPQNGTIATAPPAAPGAMDAANAVKFYTITASLREEYDDNIFTTKDNKQSSFVTNFSPSILINLPWTNSNLSARYTFGLNYYSDRPGNATDYTHEVNVLYTHQFNGRFSISAQDDFGYFTQPDLLNAVGTPFVSGNYFANTASADLEAQWTPLFGTSTNYSNIFIFYENGEISAAQNSDENSLSQDFRFAVIPKINLTAGFIVDNNDYFSSARGYTSYTLDGGVDWAVLPNLSVDARAGATVTQSTVSDEEITPYASLALNWQLGKRSNFSFSYTHDVVPTDVFNAIGSEADRFSLRFNYDITSRITVHVSGIETHSQYTSDLLESGVPSFNEDDAALDIGGSYALTSNFSLEAGYYFSDISSQESFRDYTRNQVYVGVRGTY